MPTAGAFVIKGANVRWVSGSQPNPHSHFAAKDGVSKSDGSWSRVRQCSRSGEPSLSVFTLLARQVGVALLRNKRLAWSAARIFCLLNGRDLTCTVDEAEDLMFSAASGQPDVPQIATWSWPTQRVRPNAA